MRRRPSRWSVRSLCLALEARDAVAHAAAIALELRLAGAASADSTGEARERQIGALGEPRHAVAELGELDLELAVPRRRALREDVEDQLRPIDHAQLHPLGEIARLGGRHVLVEDHEIDVALEAADHQIGELAGADHRARIDGGARLGDHVDDRDPGGPGELAQLGHVHLEGRAVAAGGDRDEDRALAVADVVGRGGAGELVLEVADPAAEFDVEIRRMAGRELRRRAPVWISGTQRRRMGERRKPVFADADRHHGVEPQQRKVGQVVPGQPLVCEMRLQEAQTAQAAATGAQTAPVRELRPRWTADHDVLDGPRPVDEHADLTTDLARELGQLARQLVRDEAVCAEAPPEQALKGLDLAGFEAVGIAVNLDEVLLLPNRWRGPFEGRRRGQGPTGVADRHTRPAPKERGPEAENRRRARARIPHYRSRGGGSRHKEGKSRGLPTDSRAGVRMRPLSAMGHSLPARPGGVCA